MTYIYGPQAHDSFGVGFVSIGQTVWELQPLEKLILNIRGLWSPQKSKVMIWIHGDRPND